MSDGIPIQPRRGRRREIIDTDIPDWITMAGLAPTALAIYVILAAHVNQERGDGRAWPTMGTLAKMVGLSRGDKLARYMAELEKLGAITIHRRQGMPARNVYDVHETPPDGYAGPLTVAAWYKTQLSPVSPSRGPLEEQAKGRTAAYPSRGTAGAPLWGDPAYPPRGVKQLRTNKDEKTTKDQTPPTPQPPHTPKPARSGKTGGESDQLENQTPDPAEVLATELADKTGWNQRVTATVLAEQVAENRRPWPVIERVMRRVAADPLTQGPNRIRVVPAQWWMDAARPPPPPKPVWCGECDKTTRQRLNADDRPYRCPACHPQRVSSAA